METFTEEQKQMCRAILEPEAKRRGLRSSKRDGNTERKVAQLPDPFELDAHCPDCHTVIATLKPIGFPGGAKITNITLKTWCPVCMKPVVAKVI